MSKADQQLFFRCRDDNRDLSAQIFFSRLHFLYDTLYEEAFFVIVKPSNSINMFEVTCLWIVLHVLILRREWTINSSSFFLVFLHLWSCGSAPDAYIGVSTVAFCNGEHPTPPGARTIQSHDPEYAEHRPHADPTFFACRVNSGHSWRVFFLMMSSIHRSMVSNHLIILLCEFIHMRSPDHWISCCPSRASFLRIIIIYNNNKKKQYHNIKIRQAYKMHVSL